MKTEISGFDLSFGFVPLKVFSDFRDVAGLKFPFQTTATFEGECFPGESLTVESIELDVEIDDSIFQKPEDK